MTTKRLEISFNGQTLGADIEQGTSLIQALEEIVKMLKDVNNNDYEQVGDID